MSVGTVATDYDLKALLDLHKKDIMQSLNCHAIGIIEGFDSSFQTAKIKIAYKKTINGVLVEYPILTECPVVILSGDKARLTFPIAVGDECVVLFNDRDIDNWYSSGQVQGLASFRLHNFTDALALVGVRSKLRKLTTYDMLRVTLQNDQALVAVSTGKIRIKNANRDLKQVLDGMIDKLADLQTALSTFAGSLSGSIDPAVIAAGAALSANLTSLSAALPTYKTTVIGDLLD